MSKENIIIEQQRKELEQKLNELASFLNKNGFSYFIVAGKENECSRYAGGDVAEIDGMLRQFAADNSQVKELFKNI
ncbi:hypothetical protein [Pedobacter sp. MW01-1-1]|uniref:hypothetical protein n=1 Tax=Pedobacter sp. MW01-1-1 TaxID=3383027 RepID=UPI003FEF6314